MISSLTNDRGDSSGPTRTKMNKPASAFWAVSATGMLQQLGASREGLSSGEARQRLIATIVALYIVSAELVKAVFYKAVNS